MHGLAEIVLPQAKDNGTSLTRRGYELHTYIHYELIKTIDTNYASYKSRLQFIRYTSYSRDRILRAKFIC